MSFLFFQVKRLLRLPYDLLFSSETGVGSLWHSSERSRALLLGLPAVLLAVFGVVFLTVAQFGAGAPLEAKYKFKKEQSEKAKQDLIVELRQEARMLQATDQASAGAQTSKLASQYIAPDDPRRQQLKDLQAEEQVYLEKLIDLNQQEPDYRFQLAMLSLERGDAARCLALLRAIAPLDEPGHLKSHLWLAGWHMNAPAKTRAEALSNLDLAMAHADQCLKRDLANIPAKRLKARLLYTKRDYNEAYNVYADLFQSEVQYFKPLLELNKRLNRDERNIEIVNQSVTRLQNLLVEPDLDDRKRAALWSDLASCYAEKGEFETIERLLEQELAKDASGAGTERVWVERLLARNYLSWIAKVAADDDEESIRTRLDLLRKAHHYDPSNEFILREFVRIGNTEFPELAAAAREIYNPANQTDAPGLVLNELGIQALSQSEYEIAIQYFSMAKDKNPRNAEILNNLSYTYLVSDRPNPSRALKLIDEAIRFVPKTEESRKYFSHFRDTKGRALMQLNRFPEAIKEFEFALLDRPENIGILEALAKSYRAAGLDPSPYLRRIEEVSNKTEPQN